MTECMGFELESALLMVVEAAAASMFRVYVDRPGFLAVNVPGRTVDRDVVLLDVGDGLPVAVWLEALRLIPASAGVLICDSGEDMEAAGDWLIAFERLDSTVQVRAGALPDVATARADRIELEDGAAALLPPSFRPSTWTPPKT